MKKTLRSKLLAWFLSFSVIVVILFLAANSLYIQQKTRISEIVTSIYNLHLDVQKDFNVTDAFFNYEANNVDFFETAQSRFLVAHKKNIDQINREINELAGSSVVSRMEVTTSLDSLKVVLNNYVLVFDQLVDLTLERGFKDYGLVGDMRDYVHKLEEYSELDQTYVLGLRRHEKDYIIRNEEQYVDKLNNLAGEFLLAIENDRSIPRTRKDAIIETLNNYLLEFNKLVELDRRIGVRAPNEGMKQQLDHLETEIELMFNRIISHAEVRKGVLFRFLEVFYGVFFLAFLVISVLLSQAISRRISAPLSLLTNHIKQLSRKNLELDESLGESFRDYETSVLYQEFRHLIEQVKQEQEDLKKVQDALIENEEKYRQLAEYLPQSVFETDQFGNLSYVNSTWMDTFQYSRDDIENGLNIITVLKAESGPLTLGNESHGSKEYTAVRQDETTFPAIVYTNKINRENKLIGFRGAIIDITERKHRMDRLVEEKERAEQSDRLKSTFLANMSHEIRTPMNAIIGFSNLLNSKEISEEEKGEYLTHIQSSGQHLLNLIDDIIDIARMEAGEMNIRKQHFLIREIFEELHFTTREQIRLQEKKELELRFVIPDEHNDITIFSDPFRLRQIMANLLNNAVKFTNSGHIEYGFRILDPTCVEFYVEDTGIGMGKTEQTDAFDRFVQLRRGQNIKQGGTGLGLSICNNLVQLLGGKIRVDSEIGRGSLFRFTIHSEETLNADFPES